MAAAVKDEHERCWTVNGRRAVRCSRRKVPNAELGDFFGEVLHAFGFEDEIKTGAERVVGTIISGVERVFAARSPVAWDSQCLADLGGSPLGHGFRSKNAVYMA